MTATFEHAIRYRDHGSTEDTLVPVEDAAAQSWAMKDLLIRQGIAAEPVTVTYTVDRKVRDEVTRDVVTEVAELVLQGEIELDAGLERIRVFSPNLLSEDEALERDHRVQCTREYWLEDLVSAIARIDGLAAGDLDCAAYDSDAEDERRDRAVDVLAGICEHTNDGRPCGLCAVVTTARTEVAA